MRIHNILVSDPHPDPNQGMKVEFVLIISPGSDENAVNNLGGLKGGDVAGILPTVL